MTYDHTLASKFDPIREPDEFISWAGRPHFFPYLISGLPVLAAGLAWGAIDLNMIRHMNPSQIGHAVPFFALHLFPLWGAMLYMGWLLLSFRNVTYAFSDRRLLLRGGAFGVSFPLLDAHGRVVPWPAPSLATQRAPVIDQLAACLSGTTQNAPSEKPDERTPKTRLKRAR